MFFILRIKKILFSLHRFTQVYGVDYVETFSPTLKQDLLRVIVSISMHYSFEIYQKNIKAAYLNSDLEEELYMEIPVLKTLVKVSGDYTKLFMD